eukprot:TRINITY_DN4850_c0_g1_i2.p1 TRINITY_DN4850_c0_g1~~TRINITY_DN4850_c0_g1_i2.p1  ORF type:complete len:483 (-),score=87.57 TRINITY_DN4850_c0_g1_i2:257-1705(-)
MSTAFLTSFVLLFALSQSAPTCPSQFEITALPGLNTTLGFKQYSGYMPINDGHGTEIFFWFVESQDAPAADPLALWMNGGPGSSSVAYGFWTEHGPFRLALQNASDPNSAVPVLYDQSWNQHANVLYIEAPSGVGFSFSTDPTKYANITDAESSLDNYNFLLQWFECFDSFKANDFYITAESYGGHYGPTLAEQLIDHEQEHTINMKGLLLGNPGINSDWYYNVNEFAFVTFMYGHALIPSPAFDRAHKACGWETFLSDCSTDFTHPSPECLAATKAAVSYIPSPLDPYNVLVPTCHHDAAQAALSDKYVSEYTPQLEQLRSKYGLDLQYNPCISSYTAGYLNRKDVLAAIHADAHYTRTWPAHPQGWEYNDGVEGAKKDIALLFPKFFERRPDWKVAVVSGTADAAVPFLGTQRWMECLGRNVTTDWRAWKMNGDVAGMVKDWDQISLITVKGCGHTIPTYCPEAGYAFFKNWLSGNWSQS